MLSKSYWKAFTTILETLSAFGVYHVTSDFRGFWSISLRVFDSKILSGKSLIMGALVALETRLKVRILAVF